MENRKSSPMITLISVFWQGLWVYDGLKYDAKNRWVSRALATIRSGAKPQYFGKQNYNWTYFPHYQKRVDLRVFSKEEGEFWRKSEPVLDLFHSF